MEERRQTIQKLIEHTADAKRRMGLIRHPLRSEPNHSLSEEMAKRAIQELDFYDVTRNEEGGKNRYPLKVIFKNGDKLVVDEVYELMWQANDDGPMAWSTQETALYSVQEARYGGFDNWRLPTLEEAMSLMRPIKHNKSYIDSVFTQSDTGVITSDRNGRRCFWIVDYSSGYYMCGGVADFGGLTARAVRTMDQSK